MAANRQKTAVESGEIDGEILTKRRVNEDMMNEAVSPNGY